MSWQGERRTRKHFMIWDFIQSLTGIPDLSSDARVISRQASSIKAGNSFFFFFSSPPPSDSSPACTTTVQSFCLNTLYNLVHLKSSIFFPETLIRSTFHVSYLVCLCLSFLFPCQSVTACLFYLARVVTSLI